jgi:hypothetical protein
LDVLYSRVHGPSLKIIEPQLATVLISHDLSIISFLIYCVRVYTVYHTTAAESEAVIDHNFKGFGSNINSWNTVIVYILLFFWVCSLKPKKKMRHADLKTFLYFFFPVFLPFFCVFLERGLSSVSNVHRVFWTFTAQIVRSDAAKENMKKEEEEQVSPSAERLIFRSDPFSVHQRQTNVYQQHQHQTSAYFYCFCLFFSFFFVLLTYFLFFIFLKFLYSCFQSNIWSVFWRGWRLSTL